MSSVDEYWIVVDEFGGKCQERLGENFASYVVFGALARGEIALGWSDIDSILVVKENPDEAKNIVEPIRIRIVEKHPWLASKTAPTWLFVWVVDIDEFIRGGKRFVNKIDLIDLKRTAKTMIGQNLIPRIVDVDLHECGTEIERTFRMYWDWLKEWKTKPPISKGYNAVAYVVVCARLSVLRKEVYAVTKDEITREFGRLYPEQKLQQTLQKALEYRSNWPVISSSADALETFYVEALDFMDRLASVAFENAI